MGKVNNVLNRYFRNKERFADLFNGIYFEGARVIRPEQLTDASEVYTDAEAENLKTGEKGEFLERIRDIKMRLDTGEVLMLLGIEHQDYVDYAMPFRGLQYDTMEYGRQLKDLRQKNDAEGSFQNKSEKLCKIKKTDRITPVYTLCIYHGEEPWDGPRCLKDMMEFGNDSTGMSNFFSDYPLRLYCLNEEEDFSIFHTEVRLLFKAMRYRKDKKNLRQLIENDPEYRSMDADTLEVISVMLNAPKLWENREKFMHMEDDKEEYDMCQAMREWVEEERNEGMKKGIEKGIEKGIKTGTLLTLISLVNQGLLQLQDAAKQVKMSETEFIEIMKTAELSQD